MPKNIRVDDEYTNRARKEGYLARSVYKLEEIQQKHHIFHDDTLHVLDIGCAPGSWLQRVSKTFQDKHIPLDAAQQPLVLGFDIKETLCTGPYVHAYEQDITDKDGVKAILETHGIEKLDCIISDMAPDTIGRADIDALRSIGLIEKTMRIYETYLKEGGTFAIKVFMGPGFDELVRDLKNEYGASNIVMFKPKSCRKASKETYIIKRG